MSTFLSSVDEVVAFVSGGYLSAPTRKGFHHMRQLAEVPVSCLDLGQYAPAVRPKLGSDAALCLYEVLSRIELPDLEMIPGPAQPESASSEIPRWTIPNTEITLERQASGEYQFSADTVSRAADFYERVRHMPYVRPVPMKDVRALSVEGGGWLVPHSFIRQLPPWLRSPVAGEAAWKWFAIVAVLILFSIPLRISFRVSHRSSKRRPFLLAVRRLALPICIMIATPLLAYVAIVQINIVGDGGGAIILVTTVLLHLTGAWIVWRIAPVIAEAIIASPRIASESVDAHLIRMFTHLAGVVGAAALLAFGADRLGLPLYGIVAGLGVGGLALALSAQPTIENLIGGLSLFADKPMKVGDLGRFGDVLGTVEAIGIRSTRIRGIDRTITSIPNATLSKSCIVNFTRRDRMLMQTVIGVRYETSPEQLRFVLAKMREMLLAHPRIHPESMRVRFVGFGASSLDIEVFAYVTTRDWPEFLAIREDVYLRMMDIIEEGGTSVAFPSQTHYVTHDPGVNAANARAAELQVGQWRAERRLPFPDFTRDHSEGIRGTLAYPPPGSPDAPAPGPEQSDQLL